MASHLDKIDILIETWLDNFAEIGLPNDKQIQLLTKLREIYADQGRKRIDIRLQQLTDENLLDIINGTTNTEEISSLHTSEVNT